MKGVSIAIETIVFIILAVTVLSVLLFFLTSNVGPVDDAVRNERQRLRFCSFYQQENPTCTEAGHANVDQDTLQEINEACTNLEIPGCSGGSSRAAELECVQHCCIFCPQ